MRNIFEIFNLKYRKQGVSKQLKIMKTNIHKIFFFCHHRLVNYVINYRSLNTASLFAYPTEAANGMYPPYKMLVPGSYTSTTIRDHSIMTYILNFNHPPNPPETIKVPRNSLTLININGCSCECLMTIKWHMKHNNFFSILKKCF